MIDISTYDEYNKFQEKLYRKKFRNDHSEGAPVCRFVLDDEKVKLFLKTEFSALIERMNIREEIESSLTEDDRTEYVLLQMEAIAKL